MHWLRLYVALYITEQQRGRGEGGGVSEHLCRQVTEIFGLKSPALFLSLSCVICSEPPPPPPLLVDVSMCAVRMVGLCIGDQCV